MRSGDANVEIDPNTVVNVRSGVNITLILIIIYRNYNDVKVILNNNRGVKVDFNLNITRQPDFMMLRPYTNRFQSEHHPTT